MTTTTTITTTTTTKIVGNSRKCDVWKDSRPDPELEVTPPRAFVGARCARII